MKSHTLILLALLTGCGGVPVNYSGVSKPSDTQYVRDVTGRTVYRITDGNVYNTNGVRVARITKK
jgi:hypothetical protein